jgi:hypothetical protein
MRVPYDVAVLSHVEESVGNDIAVKKTLHLTLCLINMRNAFSSDRTAVLFSRAIVFVVATNCFG